MANLQVKGIPDSLHRNLRRCAEKRRCTMSDIVITAVERELARSAFRERLAKRPNTDLGLPAASLLEEERRQRDESL
jgi:hypothetical protein